jgi:rare lipoprotein A
VIVIRRANVNVVALLAAAAGVLCLPSVGQADTGGAGLSTGNPGTQATGAGSGVAPGDTTVTATGNGITITTQVSGFLRNDLRFTGTVPKADAGDVIDIERLGHQTHWAWAPTTHAVAGADGAFTVVWHANHIGRFSFRAVIERAGASHAASASPTVTVTVFRLALATEFGPGFYGHTTACGKVLKRNTIGVASRTLKCGTEVAVYYQGRTMVVPVIDRGPYANGADWDLTMAAGRALGMLGSATIGAVSLPHVPLSAPAG